MLIPYFFSFLAFFFILFFMIKITSIVFVLGCVSVCLLQFLAYIFVSLSFAFSIKVHRGQIRTSKSRASPPKTPSTLIYIFLNFFCCPLFFIPEEKKWILFCIRLSSFEWSRWSLFQIYCQKVVNRQLRSLVGWLFALKCFLWFWVLQSRFPPFPIRDLFLFGKLRNRTRAKKRQ